MLKNITITNFRGFQNIAIDPLKRINLIVGKNNVGKTALLEAFFLLLGVSNPRISFELNGYRGLQSVPLNADEVWGWLFYNRKTDNHIQFTSKDDLNIEHDLKIILKAPETIQINQKRISDRIVDQNTIFSTAAINKNLTLTYTNSKKQHITTQAQIDQNQMQLQGQETSPFPLSFYLPSSVRVSAQENAVRFSNLEKIGQHNEILHILQIIEPRLQRLSVSFSGGIANINGDFGVYPLLPITYMGDGINQLLSILLAIANTSKGGCVLIDEVDNGLYYATMQKVWAAVCDLACKKDVQIIATTHSWEFIKAAYQTHKENHRDEFCLHRLERIDEKISAVSHDMENLDTFFELGWEIR